MGEASKLARTIEVAYVQGSFDSSHPDADLFAIDAALAPIREALETGLTMYELGEQIADAQFGDHRVLKRLEKLRSKKRKIIKDALSLISPATAETTGGAK